MAVLSGQSGKNTTVCSLQNLIAHVTADSSNAAAAPMLLQLLPAHMEVLDHPQAVPGMVLNMIQESASIEGMLVQATMDCAAATCVCD